MKYSGVLFDLFGTLVAPFRMREHQDALRECALRLEIPFDDIARSYGETYPRRMRGEFPSLSDYFAWIAAQNDRIATNRQVSRATERYERFVIESLAPLDDAVDILEWLAARGVRLGLVSNCAPELPGLWRKSVLGKYFDHCAFSCQVGVMKPEPVIYRTALDGLGLSPNETLYVGDGSDNELSGAARCGLMPVLVSVDLSNTYDARRTDVEAWNGKRISRLMELTKLVS